MTIMKQFIPIFPSVATLLAAAMLLFVSHAAAQSKNVLLIIADDIGIDSFPLTASAGAPLPLMPNISALKNSGVLFRNAYSQPTCSPTRACMLTGRQPFRTGIGAQLTDATSPQLSAAEFTLPDAFAANSALGYSLAMFGKWHLNSGAGTNDTPRTIGGWPSFAGTIIGALPDFNAWTKITNNVTSSSTTYATTDTANDVISFITTRPSGTPWFAWCAFNAPHAPLHTPPTALLNGHTYPATNRGYFEAMCEALDTEVGRVLANVNLTTTNVIFIGDNGTAQNVIQTPYNAAHSKETIYAGGTRVPLIIAGPVVVSPNRDSTVPVNAVDLYSTILELAGISVSTTQPAANTLDSKSLLPVLKNTTDTERTAFSQMFGTGLTSNVSGRALTDAAGYTLLQFDDGHEEFMNQTTDANQLTNLLGSSISSAAQAAYVALKQKVASLGSTGVPSTPLLSSWFTSNSGNYARIYPTLANQTARTPATTWSRGTGTQSTAAYADVNQIDYSASWVYIHTTGLASHIMGPWYLNAAKTNLFPNYPSNTATTYRFPRTPTVPTTKVSTGLGATGRMVNGVSMFDSRDAFSYSNTNTADATPGGAFTGDGIWNRDGYHNEGVTFDAALAHQAGNNYHYHAQPIGLRYQLGDHVDYNATTNRYTESAAAVTAHSPILAWAADGLPVYGPYGYSDPTSAASSVRRLISGFTLRDGTNGTTAISVRQVLPLWAQRIQSKATLDENQYGPAVNATYLLGHYIEDFDYRGDLGQLPTTDSTVRDFDLNEQNVRFCRTPEFPAGTWAYFTPINADGTPQFPYTTGRAYYGNPTGGARTAAQMNADTPLTQQFIGGANAALTVPTTPTVSSGNVTLTWSAVEGGTYSVEASPNNSNPWTGKGTGLVSTGTAKSATYTALGSSGTEFGRVNRTALAAYDATGQTAATVAQSVVASYSVTPNTPPTTAAHSLQRWFCCPGGRPAFAHAAIIPASSASNSARCARAYSTGDATANVRASGWPSKCNRIGTPRLVRSVLTRVPFIVSAQVTVLGRE